MQGNTQVKLACLLGIYAGILAGTARAAPAVHEDGRAGIRFPIPIKDAVVKSGEQVTALVLADPRVKMPAGIALTSGLYAPTGEPFLIVWTKADPPPTQKQIRDLAGTAPLLRRLLPWTKGLPEDLRFDPEALRGAGTLRTVSGLKGRALLQVTRAGSVFVGLFYREPTDAALLDTVAAGLSVLPDHTVRLADLAPGGWTLKAQMASAAFVLLTAIFLLARVVTTMRAKRGAR